MNILVIAANGRTGKEVVKLAKNNGHKVTCFIRHNEKSSEELVIKGDATNYSDIQNAIKDQDLVISTIGHIKESPDDVQTTAINNLIKAIEDNDKNIKIVSLTGNGVRQSGDKVGLLDWFMNMAVKLVDPKRISDGVNHCESLKSSDVNWSVVRVLKLTSRGMMGQFKLTEHGPAKNFVARQEVAIALLQAAETPAWDRKLPIVSKG